MPSLQRVTSTVKPMYGSINISCGWHVKAIFPDNTNLLVFDIINNAVKELLSFWTHLSINEQAMQFINLETGQLKKTHDTSIITNWQSRLSPHSR